VTSVDPGWVSDQVPRSDKPNRYAGSDKLPIDMLDAAARVCDPIFTAIQYRSPLFGVLLKDYNIAAW
jgi:hypothetical protein